MKRGSCVCVVGFAAIGVCLLVYFIHYLSTEVLSNDIYRAAVLEVVYNKNKSLSLRELVIRNLESYISAVKIAYIHDVDIIVFPENGLYGSINERNNVTYSLMENIPEPKEFDYIPCLQDDIFNKSPILQLFSCLARYGRMYIVANMIDYKLCNDSSYASDLCTNTNCPEDGIYLFNTNVVFDKNGKLVTKYHKKHLPFEDYLNPSNCYGDGYFETEFGRFFTSISSDLFYTEPNNAVKNFTPDTLVYPMYWQKPFRYFSSPFQQVYAFRHNINLLSANMNDAMTEELRSVIYSGTNGPLLLSSGPYKYNTLMISNVPKNPMDYHVPFNLRRKKFYINNKNYYEMDLEESVKFKTDCDDQQLKNVDERYKGSYCFPINTKNINSFKLENNEGSTETCTNGLCCSLEYKAKLINRDYFFLVSSNSITPPNAMPSLYRFCILTHCISEDGDNCTYLALESGSLFDEVKISGNFRSKRAFPVTVNSLLKITDREEWEFDGNSSVSYKRIQNDSLLSFGFIESTHIKFETIS